jgi:hypothetical protein
MGCPDRIPQLLDKEDEETYIQGLKATLLKIGIAEESDDNDFEITEEEHNAFVKRRRFREEWRHNGMIINRVCRNKKRR